MSATFARAQKDVGAQVFAGVADPTGMYRVRSPSVESAIRYNVSTKK